jgi:hypothetical protein
VGLRRGREEVRLAYLKRLVAFCCVLVAGACVNDPFVSLGEDEPCTECLADPIPHCIAPDACTTSAECPSGTYCAVGPSAACDDGACKRCLPATELRQARTALVSGFKVREFSLEQVEESGVFAWGQPSDAVAVTCAVFGCVPEFRVTGRFEGEPIFDFSNFDQCALAVERFDLRRVDATASTLTLDLGTLERRAVPSGSCAADGKPVSPYQSEYADGLPRVTDLLVGCWAYDYAEVIGATVLRRIDPAQAPFVGGEAPLEPVQCAGNQGALCAHAEGGFGTCSRDRCLRSSEAPSPPMVVPECEQPGRVTEGLGCYPTALGGYGTCAAAAGMRACRVRCRSRVDCDALPQNEAAEPATCCKAPGAFLGSCLHVSEGQAESGLHCDPVPNSETEGGTP